MCGPGHPGYCVANRERTLRKTMDFQIEEDFYNQVIARLFRDKSMLIDKKALQSILDVCESVANGHLHKYGKFNMGPFKVEIKTAKAKPERSFHAANGTAKTIKAISDHQQIYTSISKKFSRGVLKFMRDSLVSTDPYMTGRVIPFKRSNAARLQVSLEQQLEPQNSSAASSYSAPSRSPSDAASSSPPLHSPSSVPVRDLESDSD